MFCTDMHATVSLHIQIPGCLNALGRSHGWTVALRRNEEVNFAEMFSRSDWEALCWGNYFKEHGCTMLVYVGGHQSPLEMWVMMHDDNYYFELMPMPVVQRLPFAVLLRVATFLAGSA